MVSNLRKHICRIDATHGNGPGDQSCDSGFYSAKPGLLACLKWCHLCQREIAVNEYEAAAMNMGVIERTWNFNLYS